MRKNIITLVAGIMVLSLTACGTTTPQENAPVTSTEANSIQNENVEATTPIEEPISEEELATEEPITEFDVVDTFINKYNIVAVNQISDITEMDIQGDDYRTEFRLNAFKTALGKKGTITGGRINIVNYGTWSNDTIRIYATTDTLDNAIDIYTTIIHILDNSITDEEIADSYSSLDSVSSTNIYLGSASYISGYINCKYANGGISGYEIMIDCSKLNFME